MLSLHAFWVIKKIWKQLILIFQITIDWLTWSTNKTIEMRYWSNWAIEMWTFCDFGSTGCSSPHALSGHKEGWSLYSGFVLDEKHTWFTVVALHMSDLQEIHLYFEKKTFSLSRAHMCLILVQYSLLVPEPLLFNQIPVICCVLRTKGESITNPQWISFVWKFKLGILELCHESWNCYHVEFNCCILELLWTDWVGRAGVSIDPLSITE